MSCAPTSQLTTAPTAPLPLTQPTNAAQWALFVAQLQRILNQIAGAGAKSGINVVPARYSMFGGPALPPMTCVNCTASLDPNTPLFGAPSLKIAITGPNASVSFGTGWPLQANSNWAVSFYTQASEGVDGTLQVITPAQTYPTAFSAPTGIGWQRLADTLQLQADASTTFGITWQFPNAPGASVWLDGIQMEAYANTFMGVSPFTNMSGPQSLDQLMDGDARYAAVLTAEAQVQAQAAANTAMAQVGDLLQPVTWSATATYTQGEYVNSGGVLYQALQAVPANTLVTNTAYWRNVGSYSSLGGAVSAALASITTNTTQITQNATGISDNATAISAVQNAVNNPTTGLSATAQGVSTLNTEISTTNINVTANASAITAIKAQLPTGGAMVATVASVTAAQNAANAAQAQLNASYTLAVNANGYSTGFVDQTNGTTSQFGIMADTFSVVPSSTSGVAYTQFTNGSWQVVDASGVIRVQLGIF